MGVMSGLTTPASGTVMNKSANIVELEPVELRGHRLGIVPQLHAVQPKIDAEQNVLYAMNASNRNFLKPKPVIARELLAKVGFSEPPAAWPSAHCLWYSSVWWPSPVQSAPKPKC